MRFKVTALDSMAAETYRDSSRVAPVPDGRSRSSSPVLRAGTAFPGAIGEEMLLLTHQPFTGDSPYAVPSPIFIHAGACARYETPDELPLLLRNGLRAVRSYDRRHDLIDGEVVAGADLESSIERLFEDERAVYLHIHSATAGCFTCRATAPHSRAERRDADRCVLRRSSAPGTARSEYLNLGH